MQLPIVWRDLLSELRLPLAAVKLESAILGEHTLAASAGHSLRLMEGFLLASDLIANPPELSPSSLQALTQDVINDLTRLAKSYEINLVLDFKRTLNPVALNPLAYSYACHGLLYTSLTSMQNKPGSILRVGLKTKGRPRLSIFSADLDILKEDLRIDDVTPKNRPAPHFNGMQSGIVVADSLLRQMGSNVEFVSNQYGSGFLATFNTSRQLSLVDAL